MRDREFPQRPIVGIGVVVIEDDRVLLIRRGKEPRRGTWSLPGGAQELGEPVAKGAVREVKEETGLDIEVIGLLDVVDSIDTDDSGAVRFHYTLVDFVGRPVSGRIEASGDAAEVRWFDREGLSSLGLWSETERIIGLAFEFEDLLKGQS